MHFYEFTDSIHPSGSFSEKWRERLIVMRPIDAGTEANVNA
jgi:hypothetical protein